MITDTNIEKYRYDTIYTKEPETIAWIDSFEDDGIFVDIGANVGVYSLYCASRHDAIQVYAFEPLHKNFMALCENIEINFFNTIVPVLMSLSDYEGESIIIPKDEETGTTAYLEKYENIKKYAKYDITKTMKLDNFHLFGFRIDNVKYIKIDVDGCEDTVLRGMDRILLNGNVESLLIETVNVERIKLLMYWYGYEIDQTHKHTPNHSDVRRIANGIPERNIIFKRRETINE